MDCCASTLALPDRRQRGHRYRYLLDVSPDGTAINLMSPGLDVVRASYRDLNRGPQLLAPGKIYELKLKNLINVAGGFDAWQQAKPPSVTEKPVIV